MSRSGAATASTRADRRRFPWLLTALAAAAFVLLLALGAWQVQRLQWKLDLIARAEAAQAMPPAPIATVLAAEAPEFRRAALDCPGLATAPWVELQSIVEGKPGVRLISACPLSGGAYSHILVDRGFVADEVSARPPVRPDATAPLRVEGVLRRSGEPNPFATAAGGERLFLARDVPRMAAALGAADPAPWFLMAETSSNPEWAALRPLVPPPSFNNSHLGYAITWFGLAAALLGVYVAFLLRRLR